MSSRVPCVFPEAPQGRASEQAGGLDGEAAGWWHRKGHSHPGGPWPGPSQTLGRKQVCLFASLSQCSAVWEERSRRAVCSACDAGGEGGVSGYSPLSPPDFTVHLPRLLASRVGGPGSCVHVSMHPRGWKGERPPPGASLAAPEEQGLLRMCWQRQHGDLSPE